MDANGGTTPNIVRLRDKVKEQTSVHIFFTVATWYSVWMLMKAHLIDRVGLRDNIKVQTGGWL